MACRLDRCGAFRRPTAISTQQAAHFGTQTPAAYSQRGARLIIMACRLDRCGAFRRPTAISTQQAAPFGTQTPAAYSQRGARLIIMACRLDRCGTLLPTDRDFHSVGGVLRHADARGGFRPANAARTPPHFFPTCDVQEANLFIQVSVKSISASCRRTHRPPLRAVGHRPAGIGAVCSSFLSAPRRRDSNGPFFHLQVLPVLAAPPAPLQASAPVALPRPPLGGRSPTTSAAQSPESRLCGGLSASIHPLHSPHRPCPKIIVLRSASL